MLKRPEDKKKVEIPKEIDDKISVALEARFIADKLCEVADSLKAEAFDSISKSPDLEMVVGEAFNLAEGKLIYTSRKNRDVNTEMIQEAVEQGKISIPDLLAMVKFDANVVEKVMPEAVTEKKPTEYLQLRTQPSFNKRMAEKYEGFFSKTVDTIIGYVQQFAKAA